MRKLDALRGRLDLALVAAIVAPLVAVACGEDSVGNDAASALPDLASPAQPDLMAMADQAVLLDLTVPPDLAAPDLAAPDLAQPDLLPPCVGVAPDRMAWGAMPAPWRFFLDGGGLPDGGGQAPAPAPGDPAPAWKLTDFQPKSCGFGATYGLDTFRGRPLVVGLWAGW